MTDRRHRPTVPTRILIWVLGVFMVILAVATGLGFLGASWWMFDLAAALRVQYAVGLVLLAVVFASLRRKGLALFALLGLAVNVALIVPLYFEGRVSVASDAPQLRVMFLNTQIRGADPNGLIDDLAGGEPDLVFLSAVTDAWAVALDSAEIPYSVVQSRPRGTSLEMLLLARHGVDVETTIQDFGDGSRNMAIVAKVILDGAPVRLLGMHPVSPVARDRASVHGEQMRSLAEWADSQGDPVVILGDLNATPWSSNFRMLLAEGELINSQMGFGIQASWPAFLGPLGIPIDHFLHSRELATVERTLGPDYGSEHRSIHVVIAFRESD